MKKYLLIKFSKQAVITLTIIFLASVILTTQAAAISQNLHQQKVQQAVTEALYRTSITRDAIEREHDAVITNLVSHIETLSKNSEQRIEELTQAKNDLIQELERRDRSYAQAIAVFRDAVEDIASTPEGLAALELFNNGQEVMALEILDQLAAARKKARQTATDIQNAADSRRIATLALDALDRGKVTTEDVLKRFEAIVMLDTGVHWDWVELSRLYKTAGRLDKALSSAQSGLSAINDDRSHSVSLDEIGNIKKDQGDLNGALNAYQQSNQIFQRLADADPSSASALRDLSVSLDNIGNIKKVQGDLNGALNAYQQSLEIAQRLADADPSSAVAQRDLMVSLWKMASLDGSSTTWGQVFQQLSRMKEAGQLLPTDERFLLHSESLATQEAAAGITQ